MTAAPLRIGLVDLETSHPEAFVPVLRELGHDVTAVLDSSAMRGPEHAARFATRHGIARVAQDERELAQVCDVAILLGTDWDQHLGRIRMLRDRGIAVLVDKPVAGSAGDLRAIAAIDGAPRITGGSSLRTADEVEQWRELGRTAQTVRSTCSGPPLYYGVHAVSLAVGLLGEGFVAARSDSVEGHLSGEIRHADGPLVRIDVPRRPPGEPYRAEIRTQAGELDVVEPAGERLYRPFLAACLRYLAGDGPPPASPRGLVEPELALLAMAWSATNGGDWVDLDQPPDDWHPWSGPAFADEYLAQLERHPRTSEG